MFTCKNTCANETSIMFQTFNSCPLLLSIAPAGGGASAVCAIFYDIYNLRHIYNILFWAHKNLRCANAMRACKIAQSQILHALRLNYAIFIFCVRAFKICTPDAMFFNFEHLRTHSGKIAQPRSRLRNTNFPVWALTYILHSLL